VVKIPAKLLRHSRVHGKPLANTGKPLAKDGKPLAKDGKPLANTGKLFAKDGKSLAKDGKLRTIDAKPPRTHAARPHTPQNFCDFFDFAVKLPAITHCQADTNKHRARTGSTSSGRVLKIVPCCTIFCMVSEESGEEIIFRRGICRYMAGYKKRRR
jgi:hypothetical protein